MKNSILILLISFCGLLAQAQTDSIKLYPGKVPGALTQDIPERWMVNPDDGVSLVYKVQAPMIYFYPASNPTGASVVICPGGGYFAIAMEHEGHSLARWFATRGVTAFVLKYRLPDDSLMTDKSIRPLQDLQQVFRLLRGNPSKWGVDPAKIGVMGFSAGGHLAAMGSNHFHEQVGEIVDNSISVRPDYQILIYPLISYQIGNRDPGLRERLLGKVVTKEKLDKFSADKLVSVQTPPAFLLMAGDDFLSTDQVTSYYNQLHKYGIPVELHIYEKGGHGFSLTEKGRGHIESWENSLEGWMKDHGWMVH